MISMYLFIYFSCTNKNCEDDLYTPDAPEEYGLSGIESAGIMHCPTTVSYAYYYCNNRCSYNNNKYYCITKKHFEKYAENSCCKIHKKFENLGYLYEIDPDCGSNVETY